MKHASSFVAVFTSIRKVYLLIRPPVVQERRANPVDKKDLLNAMLHGKDPQSGKGLDDQGIQNNMITFLIAGVFPSSRE